MMMIDRRTATICAILIALMVAAPIARIILVPDTTVPVSLLRSLFLLPIIPSLLVAVLRANGRRAAAADAQFQISYDVGKFQAIGCCACILLIQGLQTVQSLGLQMPGWVGLSIVIVNTAIIMVTIDQSPKLPWFELTSRRGTELGPIYGPRFARANARIWLVGGMAIMICLYTLPGSASPYVALAILLPLTVTVAVRRHYRSKWKLEQSMMSGVKP